MKGPHWSWYVLIVFVALAPAGIRLMTWPGFRPEALDPQMVQAGQTLFVHEWTANDPLAAGGDGVGPVFNAASCVACHNQGGLGGAGGLDHNVTTYVYRSDAEAALFGKPREGVVHAEAVNCPQDTLRQLHPELPQTSKPHLTELVALSGSGSRSSNHCITVPPAVRLSQRNTPALFGASLINAIPDREIIANEKRERVNFGLASENTEVFPIGRAMRLPNGRVGHFGWKAQSASLADFVQAACANELGLGNPGQAQPRPFSYPNYQPSKYDLTLEQCDQITSYVASLPRPVQRVTEDSILRSDALEGEQLFNRTGCADCHKPDVGKVQGLYSDLLLHDMGQELEGGGSYNDGPPQPDPNQPPKDPNAPKPGEWRTPPLWGVADSAPYLHDGRAPTLERAIGLHKGQGTSSASKYAELTKSERDQLIAFLRTLRAP